jgi:hypothetical protein
MEEIDTNNINVAALLEVIDYLADSERQSYLEHIFKDVLDYMHSVKCQFFLNICLYIIRFASTKLVNFNGVY